VFAEIAETCKYNREGAVEKLTDGAMLERSV
jgi:hypothetical protein